MIEITTTFPPLDVPSSFHLTTEQIQAGMPNINQSPSDNGTLELIVIRPESDTRRVLGQVQLSQEGGVHGDRWAKESWKKLPDGRPHPDVQVALTNARLVDLLSQTKDQWSWAGDNLFVDLDLSAENLPPGAKLSIGDTILEVTAEPHNGCKKYAQRFGKDAIRFINSPEGKKLHLRGIYARVVQAGTIRVGDAISKI